jgi:hypothetical protein
VVVSEGFRRDLISRGVPAGKVCTIRNGADVDRFKPEPPDSAVRASLGVEPGEVAVLYVGAHGISHGLSSVVEAAAKLAGEPVRFVFVGEGAVKRDIERQVAELGLTNVSMHAGVPRDEVPGLLHAADICLVPLRDVPLFSTFIPSKIFEYFAAGKAVVGSVRGEPAQILREGGATVVEPEDAVALAEAIRELARDPERRAQMGAAAERYVRERFDRRRLAAEYRAVLGTLAGR